MVVLDTTSNGNVFCMVKFGAILLNVNPSTISKGRHQHIPCTFTGFSIHVFFIHAQTREVNLLHGCAWNMRCTMQAFSNWCYHFFVFQIVKWIFVILNQRPIYKNNIKGTTFLTYIQLDNMKFYPILGQSWISIYFVGRWCNKLLKTQ